MSIAPSLRVLVTGSTGLLSTALLYSAPQHVKLKGTFYRNRLVPNVPGVEYEEMDITDRASVDRVFQSFQPQVVVHTSGLGNIDYCEEHQDEAWRVNVIGTRHIVQAAEAVGAWLIFPSTSAIFDGANPPYAEDAPPRPVCYYGVTKLQSENDLKGVSVPVTIVRLTTLFGWNNPQERLNPAAWAIEQLKQQKPLALVTDVFNNFLSDQVAAEAIWRIVRGKHHGLFHVAGKEICSRYDFMMQLAEVFEFDRDLLSPVVLETFTTLAPRPKNTCFDITKMQTMLGVQPPTIHESLAWMRDHVPEATYWKKI